MLNLLFCHEDGSYTASNIRRQHLFTNFGDSFKVPSVSTFLPFYSVLQNFTGNLSSFQNKGITSSLSNGVHFNSFLKIFQLTMNYSSRGQKKSGKMEFEIAVRCRE
jgi:hypothetical protein